MSLQSSNTHGNQNKGQHKNNIIIDAHIVLSPTLVVITVVPLYLQYGQIISVGKRRPSADDNGYPVVIIIPYYGTF